MQIIRLQLPYNKESVYETWEELPIHLMNLLDVDKDGNKIPIHNAKKAFSECKTKGVGQTTILKFLGGNWKQWTRTKLFLRN